MSGAAEQTLCGFFFKSARSSRCIARSRCLQSTRREGETACLAVRTGRRSGSSGLCTLDPLLSFCFEDLYDTVVVVEDLHPELRSWCADLLQEPSTSDDQCCGIMQCSDCRDWRSGQSLCNHDFSRSDVTTHERRISLTDGCITSRGRG